MNKRKMWFLVPAGFILFIAGALVGWLDLSGLLPWQNGNVYQDPQGHFTMKIDSSNGPAREPSATPGAEQTKVFSSNLYRYEFSYPADWKIQVKHPTGAGKDPEYVTLTTSDANNLPQIDIWVLTGQAPISGYENCEKNFVFRNLPACHLSLPAGQNPLAKILIFQNGPVNFYIRMIYQEKSSMKLFDDLLSSFRFTQ